jgi:hypothetical protein
MPDPADTVAADCPCLRCGYNLRTLALDARCPECGYDVLPSTTPPARLTDYPFPRRRRVAVGIYLLIGLHLLMVLAEPAWFPPGLLLTLGGGARVVAADVIGGSASPAVLVAMSLVLLLHPISLILLTTPLGPGRRPALARAMLAAEAVACVIVIAALTDAGRFHRQWALATLFFFESMVGIALDYFAADLCKRDGGGPSTLLCHAAAFFHTIALVPLVGIPTASDPQLVFAWSALNALANLPLLLVLIVKSGSLLDVSTRPAEPAT